MTVVEVFRDRCAVSLCWVSAKELRVPDVALVLSGRESCWGDSFERFYIEMQRHLDFSSHCLLTRTYEFGFALWDVCSSVC
jgi:hypothetical protein